MSSKSDERRHKREEDLLDLAINLIDELGFGSFSLERLTCRSDYSKGTIYNHFSSKEDCLSALCVRGVDEILTLFHRAMTFDGNRRERALAMHYAYRLFSQLQPVLFMTVVNAKSPGAVDRASAHRQQAVDEASNRIGDFSDTLFREAIEAGELKSTAGISELTFANWALSFGTNVLMNHASESNTIKRLNEDRALLANMNILFDGMGWQPLSSAWDYQASWDRIGLTLFVNEIEQLGHLSLEQGILKADDECKSTACQSVKSDQLCQQDTHQTNNKTYDHDQ